MSRSLLQRGCVWRSLALGLLTLPGLGGCVVATVAGAAVGTAASVAGTAVKVGAKTAATAVDLAIPDGDEHKPDTGKASTTDKAAKGGKSR